jgi:hypothetical protein
MRCENEKSGVIRKIFLYYGKLFLIKQKRSESELEETTCFDRSWLQLILIAKSSPTSSELNKSLRTKINKKEIK